MVTLLPKGRPGPEETTAWLLAPGDQLFSGEVVRNIQREPRDRKVRVSTDQQPGGVVWDADRIVQLARRVL